jgi:hypothetical protein
MGKTVGQVAYEAWANTHAVHPLKLRGDIPWRPQQEFPWADLLPAQQAGWEAIARAVQSFYETGSQGRTK